MSLSVFCVASDKLSNRTNFAKHSTNVARRNQEYEVDNTLQYSPIIEFFSFEKKQECPYRDNPNLRE